MALKAFRDELLAIQNAYRPFHDDFKSIHAVVQALDAMAEQLTGEKDVYWRRFS